MVGEGGLGSELADGRGSPRPLGSGRMGTGTWTWAARPVWKTSDFVVVSQLQQQVPVCRTVRALAAGSGWAAQPCWFSLPVSFRVLLCLLENTSGNHPGHPWAAHPRWSLPETRPDSGVSGQPWMGWV